MSRTADKEGASGRLRQDMNGMENRKLARLILGPQASVEEIENKRIQIRKWRKLPPGKFLTQANAEAVAQVLGTDPARYMKPVLSPEEERARKIARLQAQIRRLRAEP